MALHPYVHFNGNCAEAFRFYEKVLDGRIDMMQTFAESPMASQVPPGFGDRILHVHMTIGQDALMGSDAPPDRFQKPQGFSLSVSAATRDEGERLFNALAEGGAVHMPFGETFWAAGFGMCVDRFGIPWIVNVNK